MNTTKDAEKEVIFAILYDFDKTLAPGNMQEQHLISDIGMDPKEFWNLADSLALSQNADGNLAYMWIILNNSKKTTKQDFIEYGKNIKFFKGVEEWFDRINKFGKSLGIKVEHYLISSGIAEMIEGMSIYKEFTKIYANRFMLNSNDVAFWPAQVVNYTGKTQFLYRISKGCLQENDNTVNAKTEKFRIPFTNMVYFGDGFSDVPCMSILQKYGGYAVAVYTPNKNGDAGIAEKLLNDGRVNAIAPTDYSEGSKIDKYIKTLLLKVKTDNDLKKIT